VKRDIPHILLVNPWIHDFAAYDFWAKPLGLLYLTAILARHGYVVSYIDCLDRFHPRASRTDRFARYGRGPYLKTPLPIPPMLDDVPRRYSRYGIKPSWFMEDLQHRAVPDLILITSAMTYWYPGVRELTNILKKTYPKTPIVLGGTYATLCREHALRSSGADHIAEGAGVDNVLQLVEKYTGFGVRMTFNPKDLSAFPYPAFELQRKIPYVPLLTSTGCPYACAYCASHMLNPERMLRSPESVVEEIVYWQEKHGVIDFAFYDDALLVDAEKHAMLIFEDICRKGLGVRLHTPNAVHIRNITGKMAGLMFEAGFKTLRLGLETVAFDSRKSLDVKVTEEEFNRAADHLAKAGFHRQQVGAYLLTGLPDQTIDTVINAIHTVKQKHITPILAYYSPIPHTPLWQHAVASSRYDLGSDPIFTNNAIFPCQKERFSWEAVSRLKKLIDD
jgi:radical SAM superfamily enzyme YgiQ (UPF0313 family)